MGIASKDAGDSAQRPLYIGYLKMAPKLVNPNKEELSEFYGGATIDKDQVYTGTDSDGHRQCRVTVYMEGDGLNGETIKAPLTIYFTENHKVSRTGKVKFVNKYGENAWLEDENIPDNMAWFNPSGMRKAYEGEIELLTFLRNLCNVTGVKKASELGSLSDAECYLENPAQLFEGNVSEIKEAVFSTNNSVGVVLGIRTTDDGKAYQYIYNKQFARQFVEDPSYIVASIEDWVGQGGGANIIFPASSDYSLSKYESSSMSEAPSAPTGEVKF